jgi:hypothetical protein
LALFGAADSGIGTAFLWCDTCLTGIFLHRVAIPAGVAALDSEERHRVPNFMIIPPEVSYSHEDSESEVL